MTWEPIYLDNHATTRVDPRVVAAMLPYFAECYGNPGSVGHVFGEAAKEGVEAAREQLAAAIGADSKELVFTSGATESNNLALRGVTDRPRLKGRHVITLATEHKSVLDPMTRLRHSGFEVAFAPIVPHGARYAGRINLEEFAAMLRPDTLLVSVMLANNEIGVIQPLAEISRLCKEQGVLVHCDATQGVGKMAVDVNRLGVDLLSFSAHKIYGPKGVGALYVRKRDPMVRLAPQLDGGGQEGGRRSGTLNTPGIVGFAAAVQLCLHEMDAERARLASLRERLWRGLSSGMEGVSLNGPALDDPDLRLPGNLNVSFAGVHGEALMMNVRKIAVSSGSACTSANPEPSHVLRALGLDDDATRASLRFGIGRFNTEEDIDFAIEHVWEAVERLRALGE